MKEIFNTFVEEEPFVDSHGNQAHIAARKALRQFRN
jgi:TnpA family transposase